MNHTSPLASQSVEQSHWTIRLASRVIIGATLLGLLGCGSILGSGGSGEHLEKAEEATRQGDIGRAIESYRSHIAYRLSLTDRPEWENPSFYELMIGDLELRRNDVAAALQAFERAEQAGVEAGLVSDRYRAAGTWLEQHDREIEALELLKKYRERDPLLFDAMLDRIAKEVTRREEFAIQTPATPTAPPIGIATPTIVAPE